MRWLDGIISAMDMNLGNLWEMVWDRQYLRAAIHGITKSWTQLSDFHFASLPAILIKRKVTAISDFWPPSVNESSQNCNPMDAATPMVIAEELGKCKKQGEQGNRLSPDS